MLVHSGGKLGREENLVEEADGFKVGQMIRVVNGYRQGKTAFIRKIEIPRVCYPGAEEKAIFHCQVKAQMGMSKEEFNLFTVSGKEILPADHFRGDLLIGPPSQNSK